MPLKTTTRVWIFGNSTVICVCVSPSSEHKETPCMLCVMSAVSIIPTKLIDSIQSFIESVPWTKNAFTFIPKINSAHSVVHHIKVLILPKFTKPFACKQTYKIIRNWFTDFQLQNYLQLSSLSFTFKKKKKRKTAPNQPSIITITK